MAENISRADVGYIVSDFKFPKCSSSFGMYHSLRYPFPIEVGKKIDEVKVLQKNRPLFAYRLGCCGILDRPAVGSCIDRKGAIDFLCESCHGGGGWLLC